MAKMTEKHKALAYVLNKEMGYTQTAIATLMKVSQSTVANMIKEFQFQLQINNLQKELQEARMIIEQQGLIPVEPVYFID